MKPSYPALAIAVLCLLLLSSCGGRAGPRASTEASIDPPATPATGIAAFGRTARGSEKARIVATMRTYLLALAERKGSRACGHLAASVSSEVAALESAAKKKSTRCGAQLNVITRGTSQGGPEAERNIRVREVREAAGRAFVIYSQPGIPLQFFPLVREKGAWVLAALGGSTLPDERTR